MLEPLLHYVIPFLGVSDGALPAVNSNAKKIKMADNLKTNTSSNSTFEIYFRQFVIYVVKNPYEFLSYGKGPYRNVLCWLYCGFILFRSQRLLIFVYILCIVFMILTPMMLICGILSWKLIQMTEQEKKDKKRKGGCNLI